MATFPNQTLFYCKHKNTEVPLKMVETKVVAIGKDYLSVITFRCPQCQHEIVYKITMTEAMKLMPNRANRRQRN